MPWETILPPANNPHALWSLTQFHQRDVVTACKGQLIMLLTPQDFVSKIVSKNESVFAAYSCKSDLSDEEILERANKE